MPKFYNIMLFVSMFVIWSFTVKAQVREQKNQVEEGIVEQIQNSAGNENANLEESENTMKKEERPICPYCKSKNTAIIMYGEINVSEKLEKAMENGEVIMGGCILSDDSPAFYCNDCEESFGKYDDM